MLSPFVHGAHYAFRGLRLLTHPRLRPFVLVPLAINLVLFGGGLWWGGRELDAFLEAQIARLPEWLTWLQWLIVPLIVIAAALVMFYGFTLVANVLGSPFNGVLAERVEDLLDPSVQRSQRPLWKDLIAAPLAELRKLVYFVGWAVPLLLLLLVPGLNLVFPFLWAVFGAWMLALAYLDYPLGNHGLDFAAQRRAAAGHRRLTLGFGFGVLAMTLVPGLNFVAMPAAVIGATLLWIDNRPR